MNTCVKCFRPLDVEADDFCAACLGEVDLCAILGHDPYWDEPNHCGRCDAQIDGPGSADG